MEKGLTLSLGRFPLLRALQTSERHRLLPQLIPQLSEVKDVPAPHCHQTTGFQMLLTNKPSIPPYLRGLTPFCKKYVSEVAEWRCTIRNRQVSEKAEIPLLPQRICAFYTCFLHMFLFHNVIYNPIFQMCDEV